MALDAEQGTKFFVKLFFFLKKKRNSTIWDFPGVINVVTKVNKIMEDL